MVSINLQISANLLALIEDYRFENRLPSQYAIRKLIESGLTQRPRREASKHKTYRVTRAPSVLLSAADCGAFFSEIFRFAVGIRSVPD